MPVIVGSSDEDRMIEDRPQSSSGDKSTEVDQPLEGATSMADLTQEKHAEVSPQASTGRDRFVRFLNATKANWINYHLLWLLILAIIVGVSWPLPGKTLGDARFNDGVCLVTTNATTNERICVWTSISSLCVTLLFFISGLQLKLSKMRAAVTNWRAMAIGYFLIFLLTTAFGYAVAAGPKLDPPEFSFGLSLFTIMPTTLSSCIVIVGYAKGDQALALLLSVTTNLVGVAILPLTVGWMVTVFQGDSAQQQVQVDALDLCINLVFTVLLPLIIGLAIRSSSLRVAGTVDRYAFTCKLISATALAVVPWMRISQSASSFGLVSAGSYIVLIIVAMALHVWFLVLCAVVAFVFIDRSKHIDTIKCIVLVCAQKTLPVALSVLELLPPSALGGNGGLVALAMVILHLIQTLTDSFLALKWASYTSSKTSSKSEA